MVWVSKTLEFAGKGPASFSELFSYRIKPGEEERFWSTQEKVVFLDTSFIVDGPLQHHLWSHLASDEIRRLRLTPVILPGVAHELKSLEARNKPDRYGILTAHFWVPNDLTEENTLLDINVPDALEDLVRDTWKKVGPKYLAYSRQKREAERLGLPPPPQPYLSPTDVRIAALAYLRATKWLETYVVTGDSDISSTLNALQGDCPDLHVITHQPLQEEDFVRSGLSKISLITSDVVARLREANSGYVLFLKGAPLAGRFKTDVGFWFAQSPFTSQEVYSVRVAEENALEDGWQFPDARILITDPVLVFPVLFRKGFMVKGRGDELIDPSHTYKPVSISEYLQHIKETFRLSPQLLQANRQQMVKNGLSVPFSIPLYRVDDDYMERYLPALWESVVEHRGSMKLSELKNATQPQQPLKTSL